MASHPRDAVGVGMIETLAGFPHGSLASPSRGCMMGSKTTFECPFGVGIPCLGGLGCGRQEAGSVAYFSSSPHIGDPLLHRGGMISTLGGSDGYEEAEPQKSHSESDPRWDMTSPECSRGPCWEVEAEVAWVSARRQETRARCSSYHFAMRGGSWGPGALSESLKHQESEAGSRSGTMVSSEEQEGGTSEPGRVP